MFIVRPRPRLSCAAAFRASSPSVSGARQLRPTARYLQQRRPRERLFSSGTTAGGGNEKILTATATSPSGTAAAPLKPVTEEKASSKEVAKFLFNRAWLKLEKEFGGTDSLRFPNEIIWLMGAPGSGKGTCTPAILAARGITNPPIVISQLLMEPETKAIIDRGEMVVVLTLGDSMVVEILIRSLLKCDPNFGALVDGFPRTEVQVECLKLLYDKMHELRNKYFNTPLRECFRRPIFRITVLYVDESESVRRQILRGKKVKSHNLLVQQTGQGSSVRERVTDSDEALIRARYKIFTRHFGALMRLKDLFAFHLISANVPVDEVMRAIWREFEYQSSLELDERTYDAIQSIPIAQDVGIHARQELVRRLESYQMICPEKVKQCVKLIETEFVPIIERHAISGSSMVRMENKMLDEPQNIEIIMDVLSERGYRVSVDRRVISQPIRVNPKTFEIVSHKTNVYVFNIRFPMNLIRGIFAADEKELASTAGVDSSSSSSSSSPIHHS